MSTINYTVKCYQLYCQIIPQKVNLFDYTEIDPS